MSCGVCNFYLIVLISSSPVSRAQSGVQLFDCLILMDKYFYEKLKNSVLIFSLKIYGHFLFLHSTGGM